MIALMGIGAAPGRVVMVLTDGQQISFQWEDALKLIGVMSTAAATAAQSDGVPSETYRHAAATVTKEGVDAAQRSYEEQKAGAPLPGIPKRSIPGTGITSDSQGVWIEINGDFTWEQALHHATAIAGLAHAVAMTEHYGEPVEQVSARLNAVTDAATAAVKPTVMQHFAEAKARHSTPPTQP